jgi:hypothetical protein
MMTPCMPHQHSNARNGVLVTARIYTPPDRGHSLPTQRQDQASTLPPYSMTYAQLTYALPFAASGLAMLMGLAAILVPDRAARWWGYASSDASLVRLHLGAATVASAAFCVYWQAPSAFWSVGTGWLGVAIVRVLQFRSTPICWRAAGLEFSLATGLLLGLFTN